jgi:hypothetical protein
MIPRVLQPITVKRLRVVEGMNGVPSKLNPAMLLSDKVVFDVKQL